MLTETYDFGSLIVDSANGRHLKALGSVGKNIKGSASCYRLILASILCCLIQIVQFIMILILPVDYKQFTGYTVTAS